MEDVILAQPLTNLQMELLRLYSLRLTSDDLLEVKEVLAQHFAQRLTEHVDSLWQKRAWTAATMEDWLNDDRPNLLPQAIC